MSKSPAPAHEIKGYDAVARALHWLTAILILSAIILGNRIAGAFDAPAALSEATLADLFRTSSLHKTVGVALFATALARIAWAIARRHHRPGPLHPDRRAETALAALTHWSLYGALIVMPASGWILHAASPGYAPIHWPFGQGLPFVPASATIGLALKSVHHTAAWVLYAAIVLHLAGAFKHAIADMDTTFARITSGAGRPVPPARLHLLPALAALVFWAATIGIGLWRAPLPATATDDPFAELAEEVAAPLTDPPAWTVTSGTLSLTIRQMGQEVTGSFPGWTASIAFDPDSRAGTLTARIPTGQIDLGLVTRQATGPDFLNATAFPAATYTAALAEIDGSMTATGTLALAGATAPVSFPFDLTLDRDTARAEASFTLDRRDFAIGTGVTDEKTLAFPVRIDLSLTAARD
jgi:cytochrome b561/polyisoprenoid-binding protein YceI